MIYIVPVAFVIIVALVAIGGAYSLISHLDDMIQSLGIGLVVLIGFVLAIAILFSIFYFVTKKHKGIAIILTFITIGISLYAAFQITVVYEYERYDAYYTINEFNAMDIKTNIEYTIPSGSLVQQVDEPTGEKGQIDPTPETINLMYKPNKKKDSKIIIEIDKSNIKKCGWIDCYGRLHQE